MKQLGIKNIISGRAVVLAGTQTTLPLTTMKVEHYEVRLWSNEALRRPIEQRECTIRLDENRVGHRGEDALEKTLRLFERELIFESAALCIELQEEFDFIEQNLWVKRLDHEVNGTSAVPTKDMMIIMINGGHEENREMRGSRIRSEKFRELVPVHSRHLNIEDRHGELVVETGK